MSDSPPATTAASTRPLDGLPADVPVLIAGGGPSGLMTALDLARRGVRSLVIEPRLEVDRYRPRAKTTNARTMTLLRGLGLADRLRAAAPLDVDYSEDVVFCTALDGYELRRFHHVLQLYREGFEHAPEIGQQVPQPTVERVLREAVTEHPLVDLALGLEVLSVEDPAAPRVRIGVAGGSAAVPATSAASAGEAVVRADFVIGADGGRSAVRRSLGIELQGTQAARPNFNVVFRSRELASRVSLDTAVQYWVIGEVPGMMGQLDLDGLWWAIAMGLDPADCDDPVDIVRRLAGVGDIDVEVLGTDPWTARMLLADSYGRERVHLVGDAAHLNPPFGGHGFNTCVLDGLNLSWKIAAVLRGEADESLLASYEAERRPAARHMIDVAERNNRFLSTSFVDDDLVRDDEAGERARETAHERLAVKKAEFFSEGLVLGYGYSQSPIVTGDGTPASEPDPVVYRPSAVPGRLLPHLWLSDGRAAYDALGREFTLLALVEAVPAASDVWQGDPELLRVVALAGEDRARARLLWQADYVLVRPDQHVAWRGSHVAGAAVALRRSLGLG